MKYARSYENLTLLPDGTVLTSGGESSSDGVDTSQAVYPAEIWNPDTEQWTTVASLSIPRLYHSTALLLPDGRVLMAGGGQLPGSSAINRRSSSARAAASGSGATPLGRMGAMFLFDRAEPNGYPEAGSSWISAGTLAERLRFIQALLHPSNFSGVTRPTDAGTSTVNPVALLKLKLSGASWNDAGAVADYFLGILFPGEGAANLDVYRTAAINYLNDGSADSPASTTPFSGLNNASANYDARVRGLVAMLMTSPRFQEQ